ncbi:hypothetical protein OPT61_g3790 [Boeremia exigua]|uniref:Uncharacterized protein n=1 Tax=Boeremia exigua TaxID=749465 RepID=A0ACC2IGS1_9PLEO|nr:hypothetical protein OPT61_g3790 [Boeremia exigua]
MSPGCRGSSSAVHTLPTPSRHRKLMMAWWRRDPSLWARSPAHRYAQRILRDHEAVLRTRCFSRTPSNTAQHQDHDSTTRPEGMTDHEWAQLQRYRKWKKMLQEHPYKGLFGASEDMLRGKGLADWDWVYKTFPKWMLQDMDPQKPTESDQSTDKSNSGRRYGDRSDAKVGAEEPTSAERNPSFAQPVIRTTHYERNEFGIVSPSDLRRPRDGSYVKVVGKHEKRDVPAAEIEKAKNDTLSTPTSRQHKAPSPGSEHVNATRTQSSEAPAQSRDTTITAKEASNRESSFIDAFFADEPNVYDRDLGNSKSWRQTALQRRNTANTMTRPKAESFSVAESKRSAMEVKPPPAQEIITIPSSQALVDNYPYPRSTSSPGANNKAAEDNLEPPRKKVEWSVPHAARIAQDDTTSGEVPVSAQSTSKKLQSLPKDDIDFLSADEIRAAMGRRRGEVRNSEEKHQDRQSLENSYVAAKPKALDEAVEGQVLNNHYVRRTEQEFNRAQPATQSSEVESPLNSEAAPVQMESSIDRMRRWVEEGSSSLAKHMWQVPVETGAPTEADLQFAKQMAGLGKGRRAREHISDDLETDLPMCKGLLDRLKNDENRVEHAVHLLRSPRKGVHGAEISKNLRTIRERRLRNTYERTETQFESACQTLRELDTETVQKATNAFKRRLGIASRILHKNYTLTRMLTWSAQARLDEPDLERSKAELYSEILTRLATLRDTQLALARLMDHAIHIYGVSLKPADEALSRATSNVECAESSIEKDATSAKTAGAQFLADTAAAARLTDEIQTHKSAMQGLSDDGYSREPKQVSRRSFEESNPLAHSLFRPFNLQFESLGKKTDGEIAAEKIQEAFKQKLGDKTLVQEVRSAYEDVYGPITAEHQQVSLAEEPASPKFGDVQAFEMLKDDPLHVAVHESSSVEATVANETMETTPTAEEVVVASGNDVPSPARSDVKETPASSPTAAETENDMSQEMSQEVSSSKEYSMTPRTTVADTAADVSPTTHLSTHYTILVHDPQTDTLSITTSTSGPPRDTSPALPIHQALATLKAPAKFIPYITPGLEVVTSKRHMLVLRDALDEISSTRGFETIGAQTSADTSAEAFSSPVNPIDGTSRLSPTGYSGVEQSRDQLEKDFEERRQAAAATEAARSKKTKQQAKEEGGPKKKGGSVGGVVKTAIWASAVCYIVGVTAEVTFIVEQETLVQTSLGVDTHFTFSTDILTQARIWLQNVRKRLFEEVVDRRHVPASNPLSANRAFLLATRSGGLAMRRPDLGVLAAGAKADLVVWSGRSPSMLGWRDPVAAVVLHASVGDIKHVIVDGQMTAQDYGSLQVRFLQRVERIQDVWAKMPLPGSEGEMSYGVLYERPLEADVERGEGIGYGPLFY